MFGEWIKYKRMNKIKNLRKNRKSRMFYETDQIIIGKKIDFLQGWVVLYQK